MNNIGLYQISIGNYFYIGQSQDLKKRKGEHLSRLKKGIHPNRKMQNVYAKYQDFHFQETIFCSVEELNAQEQKLLDMFWGTEGCMNLAKDAQAPGRGLQHSEETKKKLSEATAGEKNPMHGKQHSEESRKKMSEAKKGMYVGEKASMYGKTGEEHPAYNHTKYTFIHEEHGSVTCTQYELRTKYNLNQGHTSSVISGKRNHTGGWRLK